MGVKYDPPYWAGHFSSKEEYEKWLLRHAKKIKEHLLEVREKPVSER